MKEGFTHMLIPKKLVGFPPWLDGMFLFKSLLVHAWERAVSGTVKDEGGQPLPGAEVLVKSTSHGIPADADGKYFTYYQI